MKSRFNVFKLALKILYDILIVICILLVLIIVMQRISNNNQSIAGYRIFTVVSGSMLPKFNIGEVVICKEVDVSTINVGDTIVYLGEKGDFAGKTIMHDVVNIEQDEDGKYTFHARGVENNLEDPDVSADQIYGVCIYKSTLLTMLYALATSTYSSLVILFILVLNVFISFKLNQFKKLPKKLESENKVKTTENVVENNNQEENKLQEKSEVIEEISEDKKQKIIAKFRNIEAKLKEETLKRDLIEAEIRKRLKKN